jgi:hypothetical protein
LCLGYPSEGYSVFTLKLDGGDGADYAGHDDPKQQMSHDKISLKKNGRALVAGAAGPRPLPCADPWGSGLNLAKQFYMLPLVD